MEGEAKRIRSVSRSGRIRWRWRWRRRWRMGGTAESRAVVLKMHLLAKRKRNEPNGRENMGQVNEGMDAFERR